MKVIATVQAVDTGNCIGAQVQFHDYHAKISEHAQVYAVMLKAVYRAADEFAARLPKESQAIFAESMALSLGGCRAEVFEATSKMSLADMDASDLKEVIENLQGDVERADDAG